MYSQVSLTLSNPKIKNIDIYADEYDVECNLEGEILTYRGEDIESEDLFIECLRYHKLLK